MQSDGHVESSTREEVEYLRTRVQALERQEQEHERLEAALNECRRLATLTGDVSAVLIQHSSLQASLQQCAQALVTHLNAAFARIWTLNSGCCRRRALSYRWLPMVRRQ